MNKQKNRWLISTLLVLIIGNLYGFWPFALAIKNPHTLKAPNLKNKPHAPVLKQKAGTPHTLVVQTALKKLTLTYSKKQVAIKSYMMDLSMKRKKCNAHIIDRFNRDIKKMIKTNRKALKKTHGKKKGIETLEVQISGQKYFVAGRSEAGVRFLSLPREVIRMKWEEKLNCDKKPKPKKKKKIV